MKITTTGSLGNVAKPLVKKLIEVGHEVTVVSTKDDRVSEIEALGAKAMIGSIGDQKFLTEAFKGADSVYLMMPPSMGPGNMIQTIADAGQAYANAIAAAGVTRAVMLSSVGADASEGTGPVQGVHRVERILEQLDGVNVTVLRSGFFYINFLRDIPLIKSKNIFGNNYSGKDKLALTHPEDLSRALAEELESEGGDFEVKYIISDISNGDELAALFGRAIGRPQLAWTNISDEQLKKSMLTAGMPVELVGLIVEMGQAVREGIITKHFLASGANVVGQIKLDQFAGEFKAAYQQV